MPSKVECVYCSKRFYPERLKVCVHSARLHLHLQTRIRHTYVLAFRPWLGHVCMQ